MIENSEKDEIDTRILEGRVEERKIGDWVLMQFCMKKTKRYYVGEITALNGLEPVVRFLRKTKTLPSATVFIAPSAEDVSEVLDSSIIAILPSPTPGCRGEYIF
ncbi:hypothetical protein QE152_g33562 [Popillia japonica]|uniref:Uncharacterized protein n=1 Tax=Popillia japonica TaxID=7064 RepID=A0AAW1IVX9_POPJA